MSFDHPHTDKRLRARLMEVLNLVVFRKGSGVGGGHFY